MTREVIEWDGKQITEPGIYSGIPIERYHAADICDGPSISSSGLRTIFNDSPSDFYDTWRGNPDRDEEADEKDHFVLGRALHHLVLGEEGFAEEFTVHPETYKNDKNEVKPWTMAANVCKDWVAKAQLAGKTVLSPKQRDQLLGMAGLKKGQDRLETGLRNAPIVRESGILNGLIEHSGFWRDPGTGIWLKIRPDAIPIDDTMAGDLKSTLSVSYRALETVMGTLRYDMQGALIRWGLRELWDLNLEAFALIWVKTKRPFNVTPTIVRSQDMDEAEKDLRVAIDAFASGLRTGRWPGPTGPLGDAFYIGLTPWDRKRADDRRALLERGLKEGM